MMIQKLGPVSSAKNVNFKATEGTNDWPTAYNAFQNPGFNPQSQYLAPEPPKIGFFRLVFNRLTKEQIDAVNKAGKLPGNAKFYPGKINGRYSIGNKILGIKQGTRTLPAGCELRKSWLGFTKIVNKDTEGWFLRKKQA